MSELQIRRISHSQKQSFLKCPRQWELRYNEGLSQRSFSDKRPMLLGSAVHAGIARALEILYRDGEFMVRDAYSAVDEWYAKEVKPNKTHFVVGGGFERDHLYYRMMDEIKADAKKLLGYYLKRMELGTRFVPMGTAELFAGSNLGYTDTPSGACIEMNFQYDMTDAEIVEVGGMRFSGIIDAIMLDKTTNEIVIMDFKVRGTFGYDQIAMLDDQLYIYAALLSRVGVRVDKVCMFQIRSKLPADASISEKSGTPNLGGKNGFDTTVERWLETIPANIDSKIWLPRLEGKFKNLDAFVHPVYADVNSNANTMTYLNLLATARMMLDAIRRDTYAATLSSNVCKQCDFWRLCSGLQFGGDASIIIEQHYERKEGYSEEHDNTDGGEEE